MIQVWDNRRIITWKPFLFNCFFAHWSLRAILSDKKVLGTHSVPQSCLTLCNPKDCSPPGFSVHRILQARILKCMAMPSSRDTWLSFFKQLAGSPAARTLCFHCRGHGFDPWLGNWDPTAWAVQPKRINKLIKKKKNPIPREGRCYK